MGKRYGSGLRVPPPAIFIVAFLVGLWLEASLYRIRVFDADTAPVAALVIGVALVLAGVVVAIWGVVTFRRHRTAVLPFHPAHALVRSGPYRFTRNPMYLGMTLAHIGGAVVMNALWPLILLPAAVTFLVRTVVRQEEEHLASMFGEEYAQYRSSVRRWL